MDSLVKALNDRENLSLISLELFFLLKKILSFVNPGSDLFLPIEVFCIEDTRSGNGACGNTHTSVPEAI